MNHQVDSTALVPQSPFERIKQIDPDGNEFWSARDICKLLNYANWFKFQPACREVCLSFRLENESQTEMRSAFKMIEIGYGAMRKVEDWHLSALALERLLNRVASHKPEAVRELRRQSEARFRIETEIGVILYDFCESAGLSIVQQKTIGDFRFDYCIEDKLLIEIDEMRHQYELEQVRRDKQKDRAATEAGYKLLRILIPCENVAKLCGMIIKELASMTQAYIGDDLPTVDSIKRLERAKETAFAAQSRRGRIVNCPDHIYLSYNMVTFNPKPLTP